MSNMGRPPVDINRKLFETVIQLPITREMIAHIFGCCTRTIDRYVEENYGMSVKELQEKNRGLFRMNVIGKQYELARKGDRAMLIWLGKNYCGQSDNPQHDDDDKETYSRPDSMKEDESA